MINEDNQGALNHLPNRLLKWDHENLELFNLTEAKARCLEIRMQAPPVDRGSCIDGNDSNGEQGAQWERRTLSLRDIRQKHKT